MSAIKRIVPLFDRVLKTAAGILIPEKAQSTQQEGVILAAGEGGFNPHNGQRVPLSLKEGDSVLLPQFGGSTIKMDGEDLLLYRESDILAKLEK